MCVLGCTGNMHLCVVSHWQLLVKLKWPSCASGMTCACTSSAEDSSLKGLIKRVQKLEAGFVSKHWNIRVLCCVVVESFQQTHRVSVGPRCHIFVMCRQDSSAWDKN